MSKDSTVAGNAGRERGDDPLTESQEEIERLRYALWQRLGPWDDPAEFGIDVEACVNKSLSDDA